MQGVENSGTICCYWIEQPRVVRCRRLGLNSCRDYSWMRGNQRYATAPMPRFSTNESNLSAGPEGRFSPRSHLLTATGHIDTAPSQSRLGNPFILQSRARKKAVTESSRQLTGMHLSIKGRAAGPYWDAVARRRRAKQLHPSTLRPQCCRTFRVLARIPQCSPVGRARSERWRRVLSLPLQATRVPDNALASEDLYRHDRRAIPFQPIGALKQ